MASKLISRSLDLHHASFKFSAAHFTLFQSHKEALHGHNYQVRVHLSLKKKAPFMAFSDLRSHIQSVCLQWDEKVLMPAHSKKLTISDWTVPDHLHVVVQNLHYVFPKEEVVLLPTDNVTSENLAELFLEQLTWDFCEAIKVGVSESAHYWAYAQKF